MQSRLGSSHRGVVHDGDLYRVRSGGNSGRDRGHRRHLSAGIFAGGGERPVIPKLRRSKAAGAALDGVIVASVALMAVVTYQLGRAAIVDWITATVAVASLIALLRFRVSAVWLLMAAALLGWLVKKWTFSVRDRKIMRRQRSGGPLGQRQRPDSRFRHARHRSLCLPAHSISTS